MTVEESALVSMRGIHKSLPGFHLGPIDLDVDAGYVVAFLGANGSGKSTLFRMLLNLVHPDDGDLRVFGQGYPAGELAIKRDIAYAADSAGGHEEMTARDLGSFVRHWYPAWNDSKYEELLQRFDIDTTKRFGSLSKGMRKRLSAAIAIATRARLLVVDEPTESLDPIIRQHVLDEISEHAQEEDRAVVFATHVVDDVRRVADYVAFLHRGAFIGMYEKDELMRSWQALWVSGRDGGQPCEKLPGVVSADAGATTRLVTREPSRTRAALAAAEIDIVGTAAVDLDEILAHLTAMSGRSAAGRGTGTGSAGSTESTGTAGGASR